MMDAAILSSQKDRIAGVLDATDGKEGLDRLDAFANQVLNSDGTYLFPREGEYGTANDAYEITLHGVSVIAWSERDAVNLWVASAKREACSITCTLDSIDQMRNGIAPPQEHFP